MPKSSSKSFMEPAALMDAIVRAGLGRAPAAFACELIARRATAADVSAAIQSERRRHAEIEAVCRAAKLPDLAADYIRLSLPVTQVRHQLVTLTAVQAGPDIDTSLSVSELTGEASVQRRERQVQAGWSGAFARVRRGTAPKETR